MTNNWKIAEDILAKDGIAVIPTDTLYGLIGQASSKKAVKRIYKIKGRLEGKPFIVLINSYNNLKLFGIKINKDQIRFLEKIWPGKVSVIFPCLLNKWSYIHRGVGSIAFRMVGVRNKNLFKLIEKVGPLVAPSANPEGQKPAESLGQAKKYFGQEVDIYLNGGKRKAKPSTLIKFKGNNYVILRQGKIIIK